MCGIAGMIRLGGVSTAPLPRMLDALRPRGPDDVGSRSFGEAGAQPWAAIGARRLSIVDVAGGHQPISDRGRRYWVVMNGEIYNHGPLRKELASNEVAFSTHSDTEVVAALLTWMGVDRALSRLDGMFALAIVDTVSKQLTLVRDRMGVKPLYWTQLPDGTVVFASELKALRQHPDVRFVLDEDAIRAYLLFEYIPTPWTCWQGIYKLEPGTLLRVDAEGPAVERWWEPPVPEPGSGGNLVRWAQSLHGAFQVATMARMSADVEVGYLLSGGLDSSAVVAMAQSKRSKPIPTFSLAIDAPGFDEGPAARQVAAALGTAHREAHLGPADLPRLLDAITASLDEPLADSSLVATWRLMELVAEAGLKCVLSGDGADESFGGYPTVFAHNIAPWAAPFSPLLRAAVGRLPVSTEGVTRDYMARRFVEGLGLPWARRHQIWMGAWLPEELGIRSDDPVWSIVDAHARKAQGTDPASKAMYLDQRLYLCDGVLVKMDRASMAHGIEVRSPFLDRSIVELAASMPIRHKVAGRQTKIVLRRAVADLVPAEVLTRPKHGFGTPVGPWLRGPCSGLLDGVVDAVADLVPPDRLRAAIAEHRSGAADHRRRLWSAIILARWRSGPWGPG